MIKPLIERHCLYYDFSPKPCLAIFTLYKNTLTGRRFWKDENGYRYKWDELPDMEVRKTVRL